ncbi:golgin subfamily A member 6-like protein 22 [Lates japonicus]|uniref:Golgin subfamily A member 6-like protein 22 n=1 Tax=Lates japonicus TaxID=270547 RepID=A0AAD3RN54_LATJO|nr:golgin subfamily A member 6-like protein 22 [Lates japonicus]GLD74552.1 golgin subfamily A member 6-like protein 22 [Lates japonicus]
MAIKELSWEQDKKRLMEAPESARVGQKQTDMERKTKEKEEVLCSLQETVIVQQVETSKVKNYRKDFKRKVNQAVLERDELIIKMMNEKAALEGELGPAETKGSGDYPERG